MLVNECQTNNGDCEQVCTDLTVGFECGCNEGFVLNDDGQSCDELPDGAICADDCIWAADGSCDDGGPDSAFSACQFGADCTDCGPRTLVNECETNNGGCAQICTDSPGGFECDCDEGFCLNADGKSCDEIPSDALCTETCGFSNDGGCDDGGPGASFSLCAFGTDCADCGPRALVNECEVNNGGCAQVFNDTPDAFQCACNDGFLLNADGTNCDMLVNECENSNGDCAQVCTDFDVGFECSCNEGFILNADGQTCDELPANAVCSDACIWSADGSCDDGGPDADFSSCAFGTDCSDCGFRTLINECETNNGGCTQLCNDTPAGFGCACNAGFILNADGITCDEIPAEGLCTETCVFSNDGGCDDGGPGASFSLCDLGTDCADCGPRLP